MDLETETKSRDSITETYTLRNHLSIISGSTFSASKAFFMTTDLSVRILSQSLQNLCDSLNDLLFLN